MNFFFFSREGCRPQTQVSHSEGEVKFWLSPTVELARNIGLNLGMKEAERLVETRQQGDHRCLEKTLWRLRLRTSLDIVSGCCSMMGAGAPLFGVSLV
jgi:hypothetical protein